MNPLRVWWIPQVPMNTPFVVPVKTIDEAKLLIETLGRYDAYQYDQHIKPDYSNAGGLQEYDEGEWIDWHDDEGRDIDELIEDDIRERSKYKEEARRRYRA